MSGFFPSYYKRNISVSRGTELGPSDRHYLCVECDKEFTHLSLTKHTFGYHQKKTKRDYISPVASTPDPAFENSCPLCSRSIGRVSFKRHMITDHDMDPYLCARCNSSFNLYTELTHHRSLCKSDISSTEPLEDLQKSSQWSCPVCPSSLRTDQGLFAHVYCNHKPYPIALSCSFCHINFRMKSQLGSHYRIHRHELACGACGLQCFYPEHLGDHTSRCRVSGEEAGNQISPEARSNRNGKPDPVV